jgi:hypothetical protein
MHSIELSRRIEAIRNELEMMQLAEARYAAYPNPPLSELQEHTRRTERFQEIAHELLDLAVEPVD